MQLFSFKKTFIRHFEKYLHTMMLKLTEHVGIAIFLLYKQKTRWNSDIQNFYSEIWIFAYFNPKRAGLFGPISQPGGGSRPPKISETNWRNITCVVLMDSYDPPESIGTKKSTNIPFMTPQWRHKWRHVKNTKITKNRQNHGFSLFFQAKVAFFGNDVCQSMLTHVLTPNKPNK